MSCTFIFLGRGELEGEEKRVLKLTDQIKEMFDQEWSRREGRLLEILQEMLTNDAASGEKHIWF